MSDTSRTAGRSQHNRVNLALDIVIFVGFLVAMAPHWSGIAIHEWLSVAFGAAIVAHLLLNWQWIVGITRRLLGRVNWLARANYVLNVLLFIAMTIAIFTGVLISEHVMQLFGIQTARGGVWRQWHDLSANVSMILVGLHLALNWQWVTAAVRRYVVAPARGRRLHDDVAPRPSLPEA